MKKSRQKNLRPWGPDARLRAFYCIASALLLRLAFPWPGFWPLAFVALIPLALCLYSEKKARAAARWGLLFGFAYFALTADGFRVLTRYESAFTVYGSWFSYAALHSLFWAAWAAVFCFLFTRLSRWNETVRLFWGPLAFASLWVLTDWARGLGPTGDQAGSIAAALAAYPALLQSARLMGAEGITFFACWVNAFLALSLLDRRRLRAEGPATALPFLLLVFLLAALSAYGHFRLSGQSSGPRLPVCVFQPNLGQAYKLNYDNNPEIKRNLLKSLSACSRKRAPGLFVLPETVVLEFASEDMGFMADLGAAAPGGVLLGLPRREGDALYNSVIYADGAGRVLAHRDKERLVPVFEYTPFGFLSAPETLAWEYAPGKGQGPLDVNPRIASAVCLESLLPGVLAGQVRQGASLLAVLTNDAWFDGTAVAQRHLQHAMLRAVENGRFLVHAANTGISAILDDRGRVLDRAPQNAEAWVHAYPVLLREQTLYSRAGGLALILSAVLLLCMLPLCRRPPGA